MYIHKNTGIYFKYIIHISTDQTFKRKLKPFFTSLTQLLKLNFVGIFLHAGQVHKTQSCRKNIKAV